MWGCVEGCDKEDISPFTLGRIPIVLLISLSVPESVLSPWSLVSILVRVVYSSVIANYSTRGRTFASRLCCVAVVNVAIYLFIKQKIIEMTSTNSAQALRADTGT
jgi:hypothetical protein